MALGMGSGSLRCGWGVWLLALGAGSRSLEGGWGSSSSPWGRGVDPWGVAGGLALSPGDGEIPGVGSGSQPRGGAWIPEEGLTQGVSACVAVKNQARWVQQFIADMAGLYWDTKDTNFNVILVDFESEDMDVEKALQEARLPR